MVCKKIDAYGAKTLQGVRGFNTKKATASPRMRMPVSI